MVPDILFLNPKGRLIFGKPFIVLTGSVVRNHYHKLILKWK